MELMFGGMPDAGRFVVAFILVLGLIGAGALLWRRFGAGPMGPMGPRGRQPRLAVIDAASVDARRRLILIKRDNVEHLVMIGGPTDIVVESNIGRGAPTAVSRDPRPIPDNSRHPAPTDGPDWSLPLEPMARPMRASGDLDAPVAEPPRRTAREAMVESMRALRPGPVARRVAPVELEPPLEEEVAAPTLTPSPASEQMNDRPQPPLSEPRRAPSPPEAPRPQPALEPTSQSSAATDAKRPATPASRAAQSEENSLAEMAQRLEAALRRPTKPIETTTPPLAATRPPARPEPPAARKPHLDAVNAGKANVRPPEQLASPPQPDLKVLPGKAKVEPPIESLEDEMAKMLGRSPGKS